jgi:kanosamine 6-kinase
MARVVPIGGDPPREGTWLGIDLGGTKVALRAETDDGEVREHVFRWRGRGLGSDLAQLSAEVSLLRQQVPGGFAAVGIALPATVGTDGLVTAWPSRPEWLGLDVRRTFRDLFGDTPVRWADDGDLGALAEARATGCDDLLYVGVGTGVGGGLISGGELWPGLDRGSFEIGHLVTDADGPLCQCGRRGCLQATASGPATLARAARLRGTGVAYDELQQAVLADEEWAVQAVDRSCHRIAVAITGIRELLHPSLAVVGGGFAAGLPSFADMVSRHIATLARPGVPTPLVKPSLVGGLSTLHGAVALARLIGQNSTRSTATVRLHPQLALRVPPSDL